MSVGTNIFLWKVRRFKRFVGQVTMRQGVDQENVARCSEALLKQNPDIVVGWKGCP